MEIITASKWKRLNADASSGNAEAQWHLGFLYEEGAQNAAGTLLAKASKASAFSWYEAAANQGHSAAQNALSCQLSSGERKTQEMAQAITWAQKAIAKGDASAAFNLATIYRDLNKLRRAFQWYRRAARMGDAEAWLQIGLCQLFGYGAKQDFASASASFMRIQNVEPHLSSQRAREDAYYWMAVLRLMQAPNKKKNRAQIRAWLTLANADDDHEPANALLHLIGKDPIRVEHHTN